MKTTSLSIGILVLCIAPVWAQNANQDSQTAVFTILEGAKTNFPVPLNVVELQVEQPTLWNKHRETEPDAPDLEFSDAGPRVVSVTTSMDTLDDMLATEALIKLLDTIIPELKRPPMVSLAVGGLQIKGVVQRHQCIFSRVSPNATPPRGRCTVEVVQAGKITVATTQTNSN